MESFCTCGKFLQDTLKLHLKISGLLRKSPHGLKNSVLLGKFLVDLESFFYGWGSFHLVWAGYSPDVLENVQVILNSFC